jgi:two-component system, NarL family, nitrate/nitrite response regulator NarL
VSDVTVVLADDHPLYLAALRDVVRASPDLEIVAEATDGREAFDRICDLAPDVALLDVRMPGWTGPEVARRLARTDVPTRVLFLSEYRDGQLVYTALGAGGAGFLTKQSSGESIRQAILAVARGESVLAPEVGGGLVDEIRERSQEVPQLTARETEVLRLIADGMTAREIAARLHLAVATIKSHTQTLYGKLGVTDRGAAVAEGMRRRLLD